MKTHRMDVLRTGGDCKVPGASTMGFSSKVLGPQDFFIWDAGDLKFLCRYHGLIRPRNPDRKDPRELDNPYFILAQMVLPTMSGTYERWIIPKDVIQTIPMERANPFLIALFDEAERRMDAGI